MARFPLSANIRLALAEFMEDYSRDENFYFVVTATDLPTAKGLRAACTIGRYTHQHEPTIDHKDVDVDAVVIHDIHPVCCEAP
jgi:hypothetical protein